MTALLIVLTCAGGEWSPRKPPALLALEANRTGWSRIECEWTYARIDNDRVMRFVNRYGDGDWIATMLGDEKGFGGRDSETGELLRKIPEHTLIKKTGESWVHEDNGPHASLRDPKHEMTMMPDWRHAGMLAIPHFVKPWQDYAEQIWTTRTPIEYRQFKSEDGRIIVESRTSAERTSGHRWVLDPAKDFQPDRVELYDLTTGEVERESRISYRKAPDGVYFPEHVAYIFDDTKYLELKVVTARVHEDGMPTRFSPEDIGIDDGTTIYMDEKLRPPDAEPGFPVVYCQGEIIDVWEMGRRIRSGEAKLGHNVSRSQALAERGLDWRTPDPESTDKNEDDDDEYLTAEQMRRLMDANGESSGGRPTSQPADRPLTEWERYTVEFARKHRLNDEQVQKIVSILRECEQRRRSLEIVLKNKPDKLREQCDRLFEEVLKPRYERLLTRKQRKAATPEEPKP